MSSYTDFLEWKKGNFIFMYGVASSEVDLVLPGQYAIEMEEITVQEERSALAQELNSSDRATIREEIDQESKDSSFLKAVSDKQHNVSFGWRDIVLKVPVLKEGIFQGKTGVCKEILPHVSGYSRQGEILFVIGHSGAGKSETGTCRDTSTARPGLSCLSNVTKDKAYRQRAGKRHQTQQWESSKNLLCHRSESLRTTTNRTDTIAISNARSKENMSNMRYRLEEHNYHELSSMSTKRMQV
jgi:ABC-type glutathione transport system ATPase component